MITLTKIVAAGDKPYGLRLARCEGSLLVDTGRTAPTANGIKNNLDGANHYKRITDYPNQNSGNGKMGWEGGSRSPQTREDKPNDEVPPADHDEADPHGHNATQPSLYRLSYRHEQSHRHQAP